MSSAVPLTVIKGLLHSAGKLAFLRTVKPVLGEYMTVEPEDHRYQLIIYLKRPVLAIVSFVTAQDTCIVLAVCEPHDYNNNCPIACGQPYSLS